MKEMAILPSTCPVHSTPQDWYDPGCRGCVQARLDNTERSLNAVNAEVQRLRAALVTLSRYDDGLRASNWPGLADVIRDALAGDTNGSTSEER